MTPRGHVVLYTHAGLAAGGDELCHVNQTDKVHMSHSAQYQLST